MGQSSNERLYLGREDGKREIKLLKDIYKEMRLRVTSYMACSENKVDQRCMEKREHRGGEFYSRKWNEDNGERWKRNPV